jgi:hypothetical protein
MPLNPTRLLNGIKILSPIVWRTEKPVKVGSKMDFVAEFLGRKLAYTYEVTELVPNQRLVMRTADGPFAMETTYEWEKLADNKTLMKKL